MLDFETKNKYPFLKIQRSFRGQHLDKEVWSKDNILAGLKKFFDEHNRYPTALEIDKYPYLPSSRQIQRAFGGLEKLREVLGLEIVNYTKGAVRSETAVLLNKRASLVEREFEKVLVDYFGEHFVHVEKLLFNHFNNDFEHKNKSRADFYIYCKDYKFCIDVFHAKDIDMWIRILNIKLQKYRLINDLDIFLLSLNRGLSLDDNLIQKYLLSKKIPIPENIKISYPDKFSEFMKTLKPLSVG